MAGILIATGGLQQKHVQGAEQMKTQGGDNVYNLRRESSKEIHPIRTSSLNLQSLALYENIFQPPRL